MVTEGLEVKHPIKACCAVHLDECVMEPANQKTISKGNIHMNSIKVAIVVAIKREPVLSLQNSPGCTQRRKELTTLNPYAIATNLQLMFIILDLPTSHDMVNFFG
jgi:hypothetical protein